MLCTWPQPSLNKKLSQLFFKMLERRLCSMGVGRQLWMLQKSSDRASVSDLHFLFSCFQYNVLSLGYVLLRAPPIKGHTKKGRNQKWEQSNRMQLRNLYVYFYIFNTAFLQCTQGSPLPLLSSQLFCEVNYRLRDGDWNEDNSMAELRTWTMFYRVLTGRCNYSH